MKPDEAMSERSQYLTFFLAGDEYAIGILEVAEILELAELTRVPGAPPFVRGVMNLRGRVVPVLDLARKLGWPDTAMTKRTCIVILEVALDGHRTTLGVLVDAVNQVIDLSPSDVEPAPAFGTAVRVDFLLGMARAGTKFVLLLDVARVLSMDELGADPAELGLEAPAEGSSATGSDEPVAG